MIGDKLARDTLAAKKRYDRWAGVFDFLEMAFEYMAFRRWRRQLLTYAGGNICEMGIGTGRNAAFYPDDSRVTGFDISHGMLHILRQRHLKSNINFGLAIMDAQNLAYRDNHFDTMLATFIFCTISEPVIALREALRTCKPGGRLVLLEHVRINSPVAGRIMDFLNPAVYFLMGDNINRVTVDNVKKAGWQLKEVKKLGGGMVNIIIAEKGAKANAR